MPNTSTDCSVPTVRSPTLPSHSGRSTAGPIHDTIPTTDCTTRTTTTAGSSRAMSRRRHEQTDQEVEAHGDDDAVVEHEQPRHDVRRGVEDRDHRRHDVSRHQHLGEPEAREPAGARSAHDTDHDHEERPDRQTSVHEPVDGSVRRAVRGADQRGDDNPRDHRRPRVPHEEHRPRDHTEERDPRRTRGRARRGTRTPRSRSP